MAVTTYGKLSNEAQQLIDEMNKNSAAWGSASADNQNALHGKNTNLASTLDTLGYRTNYTDGAWAVSGGAEPPTTHTAPASCCKVRRGGSPHCIKSGPLHK